MFEKDLIARISELCEAGYPYEVCGLVVGKRGSCGEDRVVECRNAQDKVHDAAPTEYPHSSRKAYVIDPCSLAEAIAGMEDRKEVLKAIYHSHCDEDASFSQTDRENAERIVRDDQTSKTGNTCLRMHEVLQIVASVVDGNAVEVRSYRWDKLKRDFFENWRGVCDSGY